MKKLILSVIITLTSVLVQAQASDETIHPDSVNTTGDNFLSEITVEDLRNLIKKALDEKLGSGINTGTFKSYSLGDLIAVGTSEPDTSRRWPFRRMIYRDSTNFTILDSVEFNIIDGTIRDFNVYTHNQNSGRPLKFANSEAPLSIPYFEERYDDRIFCTQNGNLYIYVGDVLNYHPTTGKNYVPDDATVQIKSGQSSTSLYLNPNLNVLINAKLYTDLLGVLDEEPNGLTQTELSMRIITNTKNKSNSGWIWFNYLRLTGAFSKFDSEYKVVSTRSDSVINRQDLFQRSWGVLGAELSLFRRWLTKKSPSYMGLSFLASGHWAKVTRAPFDASDTNRDTSNVFLPTYGLKLYTDLRPMDNLGIELSMSYLAQHIESNSWIKNYDFTHFVRSEVMVYHNTFGNPNSKIYLRFIFNKNIEPEKAYRLKRNAFQQLQLGYNITLNRAFGRNE